jgi:hypothetical protein
VYGDEGGASRRARSTALRMGQESRLSLASVRSIVLPERHRTRGLFPTGDRLARKTNPQICLLALLRRFSFMHVGSRSAVVQKVAG